MLIEINRDLCSDLTAIGNPRYMVMQAGDETFFVADLVECIGVKCHKPECPIKWQSMSSLGAMLGLSPEDMGEMPEHSEVYSDYSDAKRITDLLNGGLVTTVPGTIPGGMIG